MRELKTIAQGNRSVKMDLETGRSSTQYFLSFPIEMEDALLYLERTLELIEYIPGIRPDLYFFDRSTLKDCKKWGSWGM